MKYLKVSLMLIAVIAAVFALYRTLFIRVVNYDIGGVKIPSEYNALTGSARPIKDYRGKTDLPTVESRRLGAAGFTEEQSAGSQMRWAIFAAWANSKPGYKGWESDPEVFARAQEEYKKNVEPRTRAIVIK